MLSAFKAQRILELKQREKSRIESVLAYGDKLLVGLNTGGLRIYRVIESTNESNGAEEATSTSETVELLDERDKFSRKPVQQLAIIKEANILISLTDGYVALYDLRTYELSERLESTKNAVCFAVISHIVKDVSSGIPTIVSRLAVAARRKILLWTWEDMEVSYASAEMTLPAPVKSLTWATGTKIVAGMDVGYVMVDLESQKISEIQKPAGPGEAVGVAGVRFGAVNSSGIGYMGMGSWVPKPLATRLSEGNMLLVKDVNSLFIDLDGKALPKRQVPWTASPEAIGYSYPYMLALQTSPKGSLEIRNPESLSLLQFISLPNATHLHVPQPNISLAHAGKGFVVASDRCIWRMGAIGYDFQIDELMQYSRYDEAISLVEMLEDTLLLDKNERLREIKMQKAESLFQRSKYREALDIFSAVSAPPGRVIALYPQSVGGEISKAEAEAPAVKGSNKVNDFDETKSGTKPTSAMLSLRSKTIPDLVQHDSDTASVRSGLSKDKDDHSLRNDKAEGRLEGRDFNIAVNELCTFLVQTRTQIQRYINYDGTLKHSLLSNTDEPKPAFVHLIHHPSAIETTDWQQRLYETATLVDTTLFRAYMLARPSLAGPLFRLDNFCSPDVVTEKLYENGRYNDLIDFLHGKKLHKEALELLEKLGKGQEEGEIDEAFRGPRRMVGYLQQLPFELIDLILQFAEWPLRADPHIGMEIFLADTETAEALPRRRVVEFLQKLDARLSIRYLEHIIEELKDETPELHDRLLHLYIDMLKGTNDGHKVDGDLDNTQQKLESFLQKSRQYNSARTLRELSTDNPRFYSSRATVLGKLLRHQEALQIYVFQLRDYQRAEEYCNRIYLSTMSATATNDPDDLSQSDSVYTTLLSLYLTPPPSNEPNLAAALDLLSRHGSRLPALSTLSILPRTLPIEKLESYFRGRMRGANSLRRQEAIVAALSGVEKTAWEAALLVGDDSGIVSNGLLNAGSGTEKVGAASGRGRNRMIMLGEDRLCGVCHKRFGRSAVKVWPDGEVMHYGCTDRRRQAEVI